MKACRQWGTLKVFLIDNNENPKEAVPGCLHSHMGDTGLVQQHFNTL